jgi:predicted ester cyclase
MSPDDSVTEASKEAIRGFVQTINEKQLDELSDDYVEHDRAYPGATTTLEDAKAKMEQLDESLSNLTISIDDMVAEGERVAVSLTASAIHEGEFYGVPPTGEQIEWAATVFARIEGGEVVEAWILRDIFGILQQLGVIEPPEG